MSMFRVFQLQLRSMTFASEKFLRLSKELLNVNLALIDVLSDQRYESYGLGEDIASMSPEITVNADHLSVSSGSPTAGTVTFIPHQYSYAVSHVAVVLQGSGLSWQIQKTYPAQPSVLFNSSQLPLLSDNNQLIVTIQPGGTFYAAALLQQITML